MCDTTFTFGQRGNHFFQCPSKRDHTRLPKKLIALLTSAQLHEVHHVALGFEDSFLLTWRDKQGRDHIESRGLPTELTNFLFATNSHDRLIRNIPAIRLTLGPYNSSFLVHDSSAYIWMNLPPNLLSALQARIKEGNWIDRPRIVVLGADSNFLLITEKHAAVWDLSCYSTLFRMLDYSRTQTRGIADVKNVVLHPYRYQCFIAQSANGTLINENIPPHEISGAESIRIAIISDTKAIERRAKDKEVMRRRLESVAARPSLQQRASSRRDLGPSFTRDLGPSFTGDLGPSFTRDLGESPRRNAGDRKQEVRAQGKGLRLSISLSVSAAGLAGSFRKVLG